MADKPASERTEKPTPERLKKAREEGQFTQSQEVPSAVMIVAMLLVLVMASGTLYRWFVVQLRDGLSSFVSTGTMGAQGFSALLADKFAGCLVMLTPFMLTAAAASVAGSILVAGLAFSPKGLKLDISRISPVKGFKNLLSLRSIVKLLISIVKLIVLLTVAWKYLSARKDSLLALQWASAEGTLCVIGRLVLGLGGRIGAAMIVIASIDLLYQRWNHRRQLRMTRQEVKEERKRYEVSPEIKGRMRAIQIALARKRMLQEVPTADVVVTNPTHYAVALRYDTEEMAAPQMVAKGADFMCEKIKEIAKANNVPIVEKPELAQALFASVEPGEAIPETLFIAVAEILAMIYRLRKRNSLPSRSTRT